MEIICVHALVVRVSDAGENDKLLTLLTVENGIMTVSVKGGRSLKNKNAALSQQFCYGTYNLKASSKFFHVFDGELSEDFYPIRTDIVKLSLASYICDVASELSPEGVGDNELLRLTLNALYALAYKGMPHEVVKAAFEFKAASIAGFMPELDCCAVCGTVESDMMYLDTRNGSLLCEDCLSLDGSVNGLDTSSVILCVPRGTLDALRFISTSPVNKFLSFRLCESEMKDFIVTSEKYLINHLEREFNTLRFYKSMLKNE